MNAHLLFDRAAGDAVASADGAVLAEQEFGDDGRNLLAGKRQGNILFVVPKFLVGKDGAVGARNGVSCGSIEEKMGIHGNSTCVMNYDDATGWLVGEANRGLTQCS